MGKYTSLKNLRINQMRYIKQFATVARDFIQQVTEHDIEKSCGFWH
jgi:hypothetical protein